MRKKLLCGALSLCLIMGVLTGCGDESKETSSSEKTKETVIEPTKSTEKNNQVDKTVAEEVEPEQEAGEDIEFNTNETISEKSITDILFDSSYKDFDELSWDDLIVAIEDEGKRWEWNNEGESLFILDRDKFGEYDCYSYFKLGKSRANLAELDFIVDLGVGTEYKNNCEELLNDLRKEMYDKNSEYHLPKSEDGDWSVVSNVGSSRDIVIGGSLPSYRIIDSDATDAYLYLLDVSDVDKNYKDDYINLILSLIPPTNSSMAYSADSGLEGEPVNTDYIYWGNWDSDCKIIKTCTVMFTNTPILYDSKMEDTHGAEVWVRWYFLDNERFTALFNEYGFTNPFE